MATSTNTAPRHPVSRAVARLHEVIDEVAQTPMWSMDPDEAAATLAAATRLVARATELQLRVAAHADNAHVGEATGATSTAVWWAHATNQTRREAFRQLRLATLL